MLRTGRCHNITHWEPRSCGLVAIFLASISQTKFIPQAASLRSLYPVRQPRNIGAMSAVELEGPRAGAVSQPAITLSSSTGNRPVSIAGFGYAKLMFPQMKF